MQGRQTERDETKSPVPKGTGTVQQGEGRKDIMILFYVDFIFTFVIMTCTFLT